MGRGRQKAKHTKVARQLKYFSPDTDLARLERELAGSNQPSEDDVWAEYAEKYNDYDEDEEEEDDEEFRP